MGPHEYKAGHVLEIVAKGGAGACSGTAGADTRLTIAAGFPVQGTREGCAHDEDGQLCSRPASDDVHQVAA